ncbi:hypothetical protein O9992_22790 [Vibrio lentus]|nr:hypothetical protein [Vibrio lentus]
MLRSNEELKTWHQDHDMKKVVDVSQHFQTMVKASFDTGIAYSDGVEVGNYAV